ncbi:MULTISPECIES: NAD(P)/FAD-dependent oxidoreductase [unclassified Bradyrhizobium]|uniref:NAD(P)/FAD-dependent oxidoreductase n=1 Tax=unclassified Bradyrhizobium TaxID=2631580 RepID=UPI002305FC50|nr:MULTISPECIES: FAD-dependent oxidoreductase [unclassified Bradyrhizobium]MDA9410967.1 cytochrome C4 [Bradyrhizobium sp. CCBAU 45384]MDA9442517.1 cytochrome C4 [Bradyrhizobium sp. CCBAU 51745]
MAELIKTDVAIVGAGVIGLAIAFRLADGGRDVVVIDPNEPGSGASYGNAGTFAPYACAPVGNPDVLSNLPSLLVGADSPLSVRLAALPALVPWLSRFLWQSMPARARRNGHALAGLLKDAIPAWRELAEQAQLADLLRYEGCLYLYRGKMPHDDGDWAARLRNELGVRQQRLSADEVARLEPALPRAAGGIFFPDAAHTVDPAALTGRLASGAAAKGALFERARVDRLQPQEGGRIHLVCGDRTIEAHSVVLAAGAWSRDLAAQAGDDIPLDTERGYHIEFAMDACPIKRPVSPVDLGFYLTPMAGRLRVAGTVELGGLEAPINPNRIALLERGVRGIFPDLGPVQSRWLGFRPSLPDSLPVIGPSRRLPNLIHAFGHGHLGLTLAGATSRVVAGLIDRRNDVPSLEAFRSGRFG